MADRPTRYAVEVTYLPRGGQQSRVEQHNAADLLESARIALAGLADRLALAHDGLVAHQHPDAAVFMARPWGRILELQDADRRPVIRLTLIDRKLRHCETCTCGIPAR